MSVEDIKFIQNAQKMMGVDIDLSIDQAKVIVKHINQYWHDGYKTGRKDSLAEAAKVVEQCVDCDPTLGKLAEAIIKL